MQDKSFEITIPVLNEEKKLSVNILKLNNFLSSNYDEKKWKIIIADNGSNDKTDKIAENLSNEYPNIYNFRLENPGVGLALKNSWNKSSSNIIGFMDLDLATDLKYIPKAINAIENFGYEVVYGSRLNVNSKVFGRPLHRELMSRVFNYILRKYLKTNISDGFCGFKFLKRGKWELLKNNGADNDGWFFSPELILVADFLNLKIFELPVEWTHGQDSRVKIIKHTIHSLKGIRKIKKFQIYGD